jgi:APA family basic amino acid/polyamine antiporter
MEESRPIPVRQLPRVLGLVAALAIVVGEVIGSGIFFKPADVARATDGYVGVILSLWVVCGLVNLCGALTLAELSAMFPHDGGTYVFLREAYGKAWAFLWCWSEFWVIRTGAIAALAVYSTMSIQSLLFKTGIAWTDEEWHLFRKLAAIGLIGAFGVINALGTRLGSGVQIVMTAIKVTFIALLALLPFLALGSTEHVASPIWPQAIDRSLWAGIGTALAAIMWAYDGWGNVTVIAGEIRDPERNVPRALTGGVLLVILLYFGANLAYHLTLPSDEIAKTFIPAQAVCEKLLPTFGGNLMLVMLVISLSGALNGNILVGPRVLFAAARDFWFLAPLRRVNRRSQTPVVAIIAECVWAIMLIVLADWSPDPDTPLYSWLTNYCVFGGSIFYFSAVLAVFVFRARRADMPRPYRVWGYPFTPALFVTFYLFLLASMVWAQPKVCLTGLLLIAAGVVVYCIIPNRSSSTV